ncbi:MAG TPA: hypothetical protein VHH88_13450 [Verrucomicrobiae bacterium]|nr:hypothetical protein [Verrucomicrobiae bacterium]
MFENMDWQQITALAIVAGTAVLLLARKTRRRKFSLEKDTPCGCSAQGISGAQKSSIVFHARKGAKPEVLVKMR